MPDEIFFRRSCYQGSVEGKNMDSSILKTIDREFESRVHKISHSYSAASLFKFIEKHEDQNWVHNS